MGCCFSKPDDEILKDDGPTEPKQATDAASPEPNISTEIVTDQATATQRPTRSTHGPRPETYFGGNNPLDFTGQLTERTKSMFQGSFSDVSQAKVRGLVVAVKAFRVTDIEGAESRIGQQLAAELYAWTKLEHPNVLRPLGFAIEDGIPCLISPWCGNGTLQKYLQKLPDTNRRRRLVREIAEGVKHLHEQKPAIIHGDLKPSNVCISDKHIAKICDFGISRLVEQLRTGLTTSGSVSINTRYSAPEILRDGQHSTLSSDVFSFACVALETMSGKYPFWKIRNSASIAQVVLDRQTPSQDDHPGVEDAIWQLLRRCWNYEPSDRPHMADVCKMLSEVGYGLSIPGPSHLAAHFDRPGRGASTV